MKRQFQTASSHRIYNRTEKALLQERIHQTRRELAMNDYNLYVLHIRLSNSLKIEDWGNIDRMTYVTMESNLHRVSERLKKKYNNLTTTKAVTDTTDTRRTVVNLSDAMLSPEEITVLVKGGNYVVTPWTVPIEDIIANIESGIRNLSSDAIRRDPTPIVNAIGSPMYTLAKYLSNLLKPFVGKTSSYIKDSSHFIEKIQTLRTQPGDIMVSFDVVSLFTRVPIKETIELLKNIFPEDIVVLFQLVLTTTYFQWNEDFYE
ncbi:hypothetical protein ANN_03254 [Periplaneta americana]|uniref:Reverse transcriptase domain-containing protein n=1 Tax=Periplaneta americana TaxID=6978 RepID=A0ABQ8TYK4_PERAM|nr:hypothetical protein ANN_03254 [Periplaneta americana]